MRNIQDYVPLYFNPKNPMFYTISENKDIIILEIKKDIIKKTNSIFSDGNAASKDSKLYKDLSFFNNEISFCLYNPTWNDIEDGKRIRCSEALIYPSIPTSFIQRIICSTEEKANLFRLIFKNLTSIPIEYHQHFFFNP